MGEHTIDTAATKQMVEAAVIQEASIIGQPGGWKIMLKVGAVERPLGTQRGNCPRLWRSLDRCVGYLKNELKICKINQLDSTDHGQVDDIRHRSDTAERMRKAHQAVEYDQWFRQQVQQGFQEASDPDVKWVSHEQVQKLWTEKRFSLSKQRS